MWRTSLLFVSVLICSCASQPSSGPTGSSPSKDAPAGPSKEATLACWRDFGSLAKAVKTKLGKQPKGRQVAAAYAELANAIDRLPLLDVDPELTALLSKVSRDTREFSAVFGRLATRREDIGYGLDKIGESFLRGATGDPFGALREDLAADREDKASLERIRTQLRADQAELSALRAKFTARYRVEFPPPE